LKKRSIEGFRTIFYTEFLNNISPVVSGFFLIIFIFRFLLSILIQVGRVLNGDLSIASTTRFTILLLNGDILIVENRNIISDFGRSGDKSLIFNRNWE